MLFNATTDAELFGNRSTRIVLVTLNNKAVANATIQLESAQYTHIHTVQSNKTTYVQS